MSLNPSIHVVPTPYVSNPINISSFSYTVSDFIMNTQITFNVILFDQNQSPICVNQVTLAGADYTAWGNDDHYVVQYICNQLNLTPQPDPQPDS